MNQHFIRLFLIVGIFCFTDGNAQSPFLVWAKNMGGTGSAIGRSITTDLNGNVISVGDFRKTVDFDPGVSISNLASSGKEDIYIQKLDVNGNLLWVKQMGGIESDKVYSVTTDNYGGIYTVGSFKDTVDFDPGLGITNLISAGYADIFIQKLDSNGNLLWVKQIGGIYGDEGYSIVSDGIGNVYVTGFFADTVDFDPGNGVANLISNADLDIFILKLNSKGSFVWAKQMGGMYNDYGFSITIDDDNNVFTTGLFQVTVDFDPGAGVSNLISSGSYDSFIQKLDSNGNFLWVNQLGGVGSDVGRGICTDLNGNVYTTGEFSDTVDFDPGVGTFRLISSGSYDIYIQKLDANGNFVWARRIGGAGWDVGHSIITDTVGNVYTTGHFEGTVDFDPGSGTTNYTTNSVSDIYIQKLDVNGNFVWAKQIGASGPDAGYSIFTDTYENIYTTGYFIGIVDFDPDTGITNLASSGSQNIFIQKLGQINTVGLDENTFLDKLAVFPNPSDGNLAIQFENNQESIQMRLFSISGQELMNKSFHQSRRMELEIKQAPGLYFLELTDEKGNRKVMKVLKK